MIIFRLRDAKPSGLLYVQVDKVNKRPVPHANLQVTAPLQSTSHLEDNAMANWKGHHDHERVCDGCSAHDPLFRMYILLRHYNEYTNGGLDCGVGKRRC